MVMIEITCAVVGEGTTFDVEIDAGKKVSKLKKAIKEQMEYTGKAYQLQLFLAKMHNVLLDEAGAAAVALDDNGTPRGFGDQMAATLFLKNRKYFEENFQPSEGEVHVLVVDPFQKFKKPIEFSELEHEGGVPSNFRTMREATVAAIASLLVRIPVIFVRAPPLSGKTAMCNLLYNHIVRVYPDALVACIRVNRLGEDDKFAAYFKQLYDYDFGKCCKLKRDRVVLIDDAQITFDIYRKHKRAGTPIVIPPENTFGLNATQSKPGLQLSCVELEEMVRNSIGALVCDLIWILCSGHIGIARAMLRILRDRVGSNTPDAEAAEMELRSVRLLEYISSSYRSIPTADAFQRVMDAHAQDAHAHVPLEDLKRKMSETLNDVASGKAVRLSDGHRTLTSLTAVELLTKYGFLYEDQEAQLQFASNMHLKIWLHSNRKDSIGYMVSNESIADFVVACVQRMSASRLKYFAEENPSSIARERQIQMELYSATTSCLPRDVLVTPEWRTDDGKGFIDLVIRGRSIFWFWELLVNGGDAVGHANRFENGGSTMGA